MQEIAERVDAILVPELNLGQYVIAVQAAVQGRCRVVPLGRADGELFTPEEIAAAAREVQDAKGGIVHA